NSEVSALLREGPKIAAAISPAAASMARSSSSRRLGVVIIVVNLKFGFRSRRQRVAAIPHDNRKAFWRGPRHRKLVGGFRWNSEKMPLDHSKFTRPNHPYLIGRNELALQLSNLKLSTPRSSPQQPLALRRTAAARGGDLAQASDVTRDARQTISA